MPGVGVGEGGARGGGGRGREGEGRGCVVVVVVVLLPVRRRAARGHLRMSVDEQVRGPGGWVGRYVNSERRWRRALFLQRPLPGSSDARGSREAGTSKGGWCGIAGMELRAPAAAPSKGGRRDTGGAGATASSALGGDDMS